MDRLELASKLHISTIDAQCAELAKEFGTGIEIAEFCWAQYLDHDREAHKERCLEMMKGPESFWFHAPFAELSPCAIDPKVRELTGERYSDSIELAGELGINRIVIHGGFIPRVYFPEYYVEASVEFWKGLLPRLPDTTVIALENVMEPKPGLLADIVKGVSDKKLGLCLDVGHANCGYSETPPMEWIEPMAPYLKHVHIHNNNGTDDLHEALGKGTAPMERILDKILSAAPAATFTIENQHSRDSLIWLKQKGYI